MGPQAAGGVAQVGRSWEGDRRGKRDREVGWRQTWRDRERHLHRERHRQRDGEIEAGQQRTPPKPHYHCWASNHQVPSNNSLLLGERQYWRDNFCDMQIHRKGVKLRAEWGHDKTIW